MESEAGMLNYLRASGTEGLTRRLVSTDGVGDDEMWKNFTEHLRSGLFSKGEGLGVVLVRLYCVCSCECVMLVNLII